ncbi:recombinase family protein [Maricaulis sp.]|uniref:recombinase family protein n=1 Tax=Maricaulis sp. TaxID=1486257 RepID=UPI003A91065E
MTRPAIKRCAIYTRKSSEEGLDQAFNSLDAQREACAAYIQSQAGEGWRAMPSLYDDGGISGATMERPGLQSLLAEIRNGQVDVVVVYKIDRLTRSLADFARMVEVFDAHEVSFVSVTQAFNTTSSMGRLTLNVLLSFAQFEREVTGERIRDKIAASKAKGMWMGGAVPLGYDVPAAPSRALRVNEAEARQVREIFERYLALGSVHKLEAELAQAGIRSKQRITAKGRAIGGKAFSRGALFHLLRNKTYLGLIVHRDKTHPGQHPAIIEPELFEAVQACLSANARRTSAAAQTRTRLALTARIFDVDGNPMSPTTARGSKGKLYRYYVSAPLQQGRPRPAADTGVRRVAATQTEARLADVVNRLTGEEHPTPLALIRRVEVHADHVRIRLPANRLTSVRERLAEGETVSRVEGDRTCRQLIIPMRLKPQSGRSWIEPVSDSPRQPDPALVSALRQAHTMMTRDARGLPILLSAPAGPYRRKLIRLALLAPDLQKQILDGRQPHGLTVSQLIACDLPLSWPAQRAMIQALATNPAKP